MTTPLSPTREDYLIAWLSAAAIMVHIFESAIPSIVPGIKPGLANIITISVLCIYGFRIAAWVSILRVLVGSMLIGTFLSPTFFMSASGALASLCVLWLATRTPTAVFSAVGLSLLAALAHMTGQFVCAWLLFIPHTGLWRLFPVLMTVAVIAGIINGIISHKLVNRLTPLVR
jgi:heptaprenyl diphosphate synthase